MQQSAGGCSTAQEAAACAGKKLWALSQHKLMSLYKISTWVSRCFQLPGRLCPGRGEALACLPAFGGSQDDVPAQSTAQHGTSALALCAARASAPSNLRLAFFSFFKCKTMKLDVILAGASGGERLVTARALGSELFIIHLLWLPNAVSGLHRPSAVGGWWRDQQPHSVATCKQPLSNHSPPLWEN